MITQSPIGIEIFIELKNNVMDIHVLFLCIFTKTKYNKTLLIGHVLQIMFVRINENPNKIPDKPNNAYFLMKNDIINSIYLIIFFCLNSMLDIIKEISLPNNFPNLNIYN